MFHTSFVENNFLRFYKKNIDGAKQNPDFP